MVIPVRDRADVIGRATAGVLAQTFGDVEVVVVDDGSVDDSVAAARSVSDGRVRIVRQESAGTAAAITSGLGRAGGEWCLVLDPDDEVAPGWLARLGRLIDATGADLVSCGGEERHLDGSFTTVEPQPCSVPSEEVALCFRSGAFAAPRRLLVELGGFGGPGDERTPAEVGALLVAAVRDRGGRIVSTPERLVQWNARVPDDDPGSGDDTVSGDRVRLHAMLQAIDALARTPIPDATLLARYATIGGVAAAKLRDRSEARRLFTLARRVEPTTAKHWARWIVACVPVVSDRVWEPDDGSLPGTDVEHGSDDGSGEGSGASHDAEALHEARAHG